MTTTTARLLPVQPGKVRNAIMNTLSRHGVSQSTAESIWLDLTTGQDPRPADVPEYLHFRGLRLTWPRGRHTRPLVKAEIDVFNAALHAAGEHRAERMLDLEDTAEVGRHTYVFLLTRKQGKHDVPYNSEPVRAEAMRQLVEEATEARREANAPVLIHEPEPISTEDANAILSGGPVACPFTWDACIDMQEQGDGACDEHLPLTREQLIEARTKVQVVVKPDVPVAEQVTPEPEPVDEITALLADIAALNKRFGA